MDAVDAAHELAQVESRRLHELIQELKSRHARHIDEQNQHLAVLFEIEKSVTALFKQAGGIGVTLPKNDKTTPSASNVGVYTHTHNQELQHQQDDDVLKEGHHIGNEDDQLHPISPTTETPPTSRASATLEILRTASPTKVAHKHRIGYRWAAKIAEHSAFFLGISIAILLNAVFISVTSDEYMARVIGQWSQTPNDTQIESSHMPAPPLWMFYTELVFTVVFSLELMVRLCGEGIGFLFGPNRAWNALDSVCLISVYSDIALSTIAITGFNYSFLRLLRVAKALRSMRLIRGLRFMRDFNMMLMTLYKSVAAFFSAFCALFSIAFVMSLAFLGLLAEQIHTSKGGDESIYGVIDYFGSFGKIVVTICTAVFEGGRKYYDTLEPVSQGLAVLFLLCIVLVVLGPLNIVTGIFVELASETMRTDWEYSKLKQREKTEATIRMFSHLFHDLDADHSGFILCEEWFEFTKTAAAHDAFSVLNLEVEKFASDGFFDLVDSDKSGTVSHAEFMSACLMGVSDESPVNEVTLRRHIQDLSNAINGQTRSCISDALKQLKVELIGLGAKADVNV